MVERIRNSLVAEEIAAQAGTEETPPLFLNELLTPVIFGPQRPPLATSGYFPGCSGVFVGAVTDNTSQSGIFLEGTNSDSILLIKRIIIMNNTAGGLFYEINRSDNANGMSALPLVPGYINAGNAATLAVQSVVRSNTVGALGDRMALVEVGANSHETFDGPWILNNGALIVACNTVNTPCHAYFSYEHWPSIRRQPITA